MHQWYLGRMEKRFRYRAYPTPGQEAALARLFGCVRVVFNDAIAARDAARRDGARYPTQGELSRRLLTDAKRTPERAWLTEVSSVPLQQSLADAERAYRNFFDSATGKRKGKRVGRPRFKSRRDNNQAARFTKNAGFKVAETTHGVGHVSLPKVGRVRFVLSRELPSAPSSVTIVCEPDGRYYVSFVVKEERLRFVPLYTRTAAVDLGLIDFATVVYSDGTREKVANPRHMRARQRKLARAQRALARKEKGSANRTKARVEVAVQHRKTREARQDFHHQLVARLVRENQAVAVEKLNVVDLARSGARGKRGAGMRRSVADAGWGQFLRLVQEKCTEQERRFTAVNPAYSSQTCSVCGVLDGPKPLSVRDWSCKDSCNARLDRDYNAAVNIMVAAGLAETLNACGRDVRLRLAGADANEAGTHRSELIGLAA